MSPKFSLPKRIPREPMRWLGAEVLAIQAWQQTGRVSRTRQTNRASTQGLRKIGGKNEFSQEGQKGVCDGSKG